MIKISKFLLLGTVLSLGLGSCLKDKGYDENEYGLDLSSVPKVIELGFPSNAANTRTYGLDFEDKQITINAFNVRLAAELPAEQDLIITLDTTGAAAAIRGIDSTYRVLPNSFYTLKSGLRVTIPAGTRQVPFEVVTNAIQFDPSTTYGLYFKITAVDKTGYNISKNFGTFVAIFGAKNKFDGVYRLKVKMTANDRPAVNTGASWEWGGPVELQTVSGVTVSLYDAWGFEDYIQPIQTSALDFSGFGATAPRFTFDPATNKMIAAFNAFPNPPNGRQFQIDPNPALDSKWDPVTKNVYAHFIMTQPGFGPLLIADTFLYVGPR